MPWLCNMIAKGRKEKQPLIGCTSVGQVLVWTLGCSELSVSTGARKHGKHLLHDMCCACLNEYRPFCRNEVLFRHFPSLWGEGGLSLSWRWKVVSCCLPLRLFFICPAGAFFSWVLVWAWASAVWLLALPLASWVMQEYGEQRSSPGYLWAWSSSWSSLKSWVSTASLLPLSSPQSKRRSMM